MRQENAWETYANQGSTCSLGTDESHEGIANGREGDREDDSQVVLRVGEVLHHVTTSPSGSVPATLPERHENP